MADGTIFMAGGNNVTLSTATAASVTSITVSGANAGGAQTGISSIGNSETTYTSGQVRLSGTNNVTVFSTTGQAFVVSGANTHAQQTAISGIGNTETTYTSGTVELEGTNNITVFSTTGQRLRISGANTHAQQTGISSISVTNTEYTSGRVVFTGSNMVTVKSSAAGQTVILDATQTNQSAIKALGASNTGNTAGNTGVSTGIDWVIAGTNNITVSESTAAGGPNTLWLSAPNAGGAGQFSGGVSTGGNTAGDTGVTGTRLVFVGSNSISLSQATDANGGTITFNDGGPKQFSAGVSTMGNTGGSTGVTGTRLVFVATNGLSLSQATDANGGTITVDQVPLSSNFQFVPMNTTTGQMGNGTVLVMPITIPHRLSASRVHMFGSVSLSSSSNSSHGGTLSLGFGIYTKNASTLSLATSLTGSYAWTNTSNNSQSVLASARAWTLSTNSIDMPPGIYWVAAWSRTSTVNANWITLSNRIANIPTGGSGAALALGEFLSATSASYQALLGQGFLSVTSTNIPASIAFSDITGSFGSAYGFPVFVMANQTL